MKLDMLFQKNVRIIIDKNFFELERFDFSLRVGSRRDMGLFRVQNEYAAGQEKTGTSTICVIIEK